MLQIVLVLKGIIRTITAIAMVIPIVATMNLPDMPWVEYKSTENCTNPYITEYADPDVSAHRSGAGIAPQNTLMAFEKVIEENNSLGVDTFEFDVQKNNTDMLARTQNSLYASFKNGNNPS